LHHMLGPCRVGVERLEGLVDTSSYVGRHGVVTSTRRFTVSHYQEGSQAK
jgi:hypothetical protein